MPSSVPKLILLLAMSLAAPAPGSAQATAEPLFTATEDTLGNPISYPAAGAAEISASVVTLLPGDSTGWHRHAVPTVGYLLAGELRVEYATGEVHRYRTGDGLLEAQHVAHNGHNDGSDPVRIVVFAAGAVGMPITEPADPPRPGDFVDLQDAVPGIAVELRYFGSNNFLGRRVVGYEANVVYLTAPAAAALAAVQAQLAGDGLGLKVFDAYRPQRAVDDFMRWAANPDDTAMKAAYYPALDKAQLIPQGYIAERSGHSRGSTVDLTLVELASGDEVDMGSPYDFFDPISWPDSNAVADPARASRAKLRDIMLRHGFQPLDQEWWHFTLRDEPHPATYFDFPVR
jgi:D-alanyl-D-alanine dipeptidase